MILSDEERRLLTETNDAYSTMADYARSWVARQDPAALRSYYEARESYLASLDLLYAIYQREYEH